MKDFKTLLKPAVEGLRKAHEAVPGGPKQAMHRGALATALNNAESVLRDLEAPPLPEAIEEPAETPEVES